MILRRITEHVKAQNWFAVGIDFLIVVVGVFVGLQVSNWNDARTDQTRARAYLERIGADLDADIASVSDRSSFWGNVSDYGAKGISYAETGVAVDSSYWELLLAYFQASQVAEFVTLQATYDELKSAGELGLIADLKLRDELADYYLFEAAATVGERPAYREHVRGVVPLDIQTYIWEECYTSDFSGVQKMFECASPITEAHAKEIVDVIAGDAVLMKELRYWMSTMHVASLIGRDRSNYATALRDSIRAKLGVSSQEAEQ